MFDSLPHHFRKYNLNADVRTLLLLRKSMERGLVLTLGDLFLTLKGLITKDPKEFGPYTTAFYEYFLSIDIKKGERLETAILRSDTFKDWQKVRLEEDEFVPDLSEAKEWVERFLDEVHLSQLDIKRVLSGENILNNDDPNRPDLNPDDSPEVPEKIEDAADYRNISLKELRERMEKIAAQQKGKHSGGNRWIGQGGRSPFGHGGAAMGGIRMGGSGGGKMARAVVGDPNFYPVDRKVSLSDNNIDVALASLKGIEEESAEIMLDIPTTIKEGLKQGGIFLPYEKEKINKKVQVILLIDNGGLSMTPYIRNVTKLFSKMKTRFAHDLKTYYYHNTLYGGVYSDVRRREFVSIDKLIKMDKNYSLFIIGDADMAPYELSDDSIASWQRLKEHYARTVWMNPLDQRHWALSDTVPYLKRTIPMFPLTPKGVQEAVELMNKKRVYSKL
ncbi:MAG: hypothetical protein AAF587_14560 [Bacteroidota bacterium]